jgi:S-adenosylmethionine-diacylglycerol 3-amino-3-carboxypropyl transferase
MNSQARALLKEAVIDSTANSEQTFLKKMFAHWFSGFVYNQIWEDPEVDAQALRLNGLSRILTISSGGCNLLNYLTYEPMCIDAVDLNIHHLHFSALKIAALKNLPDYESFFSFFAEGNSTSNVMKYAQCIARHLTSEQRSYWEDRLPLRFYGAQRRIEYFQYGIYRYSRSAKFLGFLHCLTKCIGCDTEKLLSAKDKKEQAELFERFLQPAFEHWIVKNVGKLPPVVYSLGIPPQQFDHLSADSKQGIIDVFMERTRRLACEFDISKNYFAWQAFGRKYNIEKQEALPRYLQEQHYAKLKEQTHKIRLHHIDLTSFLRGQAAMSLNSFIFLDSQDWMTKGQLTNLWSEVLRVGTRDSKAIFRTAGSHSPLESSLPADLLHRFIYKEAESRDGLQRDRAAIYGGFHLYERASEISL